MHLARLLCLSAVLCSPVVGAVITESETNNTGSNNQFATAQAIAASAFTAPAPLGVFGGASLTATVRGNGGNSDVDFYSFVASGSLQLSITDVPYTFATIVSLFNSAGQLLAYDDSSTPLKPGSVSTNDSFVGLFTLPNPGLYYVAVTSADFSIPNYPDTSSCSGFNVLTRPDGGFGGIATTGCSASASPFFVNGVQPSSPSAYTLQIAQAPEPGTWVITALGIALVTLRKKIFA